jgi:hypothetical protein
MGWLDKLRRREPAPDEDDDADVGTDPGIDRAARRPQLDELDEALRALARQMAADPDRMRNPGWAARVQDLRSIAREAVDLAPTEFSRTDVLDLVASVAPLPPGPDYEPYRDAGERVEAAREALRAVLPSEV